MYIYRDKACKQTQFYLDDVLDDIFYNCKVPIKNMLQYI